jgi:hypothetical protein
MKMKQLFALAGLMTLAVAPGHARDYREARVTAKARAWQLQRGVCAYGARAAGHRADAPRTAAVAPVAIDSETGELYTPPAAPAGQQTRA